jgi:DNA-binding NarL/FixJ family response regulator
MNRGALADVRRRCHESLADATSSHGGRMRTATTRPPFTHRQCEIISLAAQGLSNKEIADRLTTSIRSIEGHLFRASQRVGANSREQLISILRGG